jgi:peroxiredoxin
LQKNKKEIYSLNSVIAAVASAGPADVRKTQKSLGIDFILIPGPHRDILKTYGAFNEVKRRAQPATFIIDKAGTIRWKYIGQNDYDRPSSGQIIRQLKKLQ